MFSLFFFLFSALPLPARAGERYIIESETDSATINKISDAEQCSQAYDDKDYATAIPICKRAAANGDASAQSNLGSMYFSGEGIKQDSAAAAFWYRKAAEQGDDSAQFGLALSYATGLGVKQDSVEAANWFRKSTEPNDSNRHRSYPAMMMALESAAEMEVSAAQYELASFRPETAFFRTS